MAPENYEFVCETHEDYGSLGWRLKKFSGFDPLDGMAVAHDCLEHFPDLDTSLDAEFMALGAAMLIRGETGYDRRGGDAHINNIVSEYPNLFGYFMGGSTFRECRLNRRGVPGTTDRAFEEIGLRAAKLLRGEFSDGRYKLGDMTAFVKRSIPWLYRGYLRARDERYKGENIIMLMEDCFRGIESEANKHLKNAIEGFELTVTFDLAAGYKPTVKMIREGMEDDDDYAADYE